jgi:uncharacterized protein
MTLGGTFLFAGPRETVWTTLLDPAVLAKALPGTRTLVKTGDDRFEGVMKVSIGPVTAAEFAVVVTLKEQRPPEHFEMAIDGKGGLGFVRGSATVDLQSQDAGTLMTYTSDVNVGGKIAAVGQRMVESVAKMMMRQALDALNAEVTSRLRAGT